MAQELGENGHVRREGSAVCADRSLWFTAGIPGLALPVGRSADGRPEWSRLGPAGQLPQLWGESTNRSRTGTVPHPTRPRPQAPPPLLSPAGRGKPLETTEKGEHCQSPACPALGPSEVLQLMIACPGTSYDGHLALPCACCCLKMAIAEMLWDLPHRTCGIAEL